MSDLLEDRLRAHADLGLLTAQQPAMLNRAEAHIAEGSLTAARRRPRPHRGCLLPAVVTALLTVSVAGGAAAATGLWNPSLGDENRGHPSVAVGDVPADQLEQFGVLRRPADKLDRDALTQRALRDLDSRYEGVNVDRIRAAHDIPNAKRYLIVPVESSDSDIKNALCLYSIDREGGGIGCWNTHQILKGQAVLAALPANTTTTPRTATDLQSLRPSPVGATEFGLVPDGVATVTTPAGVSAEVHDNVFALATDTPGTGQITWQDRNGKTVSKESQ